MYSQQKLLVNTFDMNYDFGEISLTGSAQECQFGERKGSKGKNKCNAKTKPEFVDAG